MNEPSRHAPDAGAPLMSPSEFDESVAHIRAACVVAGFLALVTFGYWFLVGRHHESILPISTTPIMAIECMIYSVCAVLVYALSRAACAFLFYFHILVIAMSLVALSPVGFIEVPLVFVLYRSMKTSARLHALVRMAKRAPA